MKTGRATAQVQNSLVSYTCHAEAFKAGHQVQTDSTIFTWDGHTVVNVHITEGATVAHGAQAGEGCHPITAGGTTMAGRRPTFIVVQ